MTLIEVCDNGTGITDQDAQVMALPYHTSKIKSFEDLGLHIILFHAEKFNKMDFLLIININEKVTRL